MDELGTEAGAPGAAAKHPRWRIPVPGAIGYDRWQVRVAAPGGPPDDS